MTRQIFFWGGGLIISLNADIVSQVAKTKWSQTLWVDLDIHLLQEGVEFFVQNLRKLPKDVRALPTACFVEGRMMEFRDSLPFLLDLKNEALRERSVLS